MADIAASVLAKLRNKAKASGISYQQCLQLFVQEEFLRRLSKSEYEDMQKRWKYFLKTIKDDTLEFSVVIQSIQTFLEPVFDSIVNEDEWQKMWFSTDNKWRVIKGNE